MYDAFKRKKINDATLVAWSEEGRGSSDARGFPKNEITAVLAEPIPSRLSELIDRMKQGQQTTQSED